jgi:hypothetical protein
MRMWILLIKNRIRIFSPTWYPKSNFISYKKKKKMLKKANFKSKYD